MKNKKQETSDRQLIIDATNYSLGRLASYAAKQALLGKSIIITNCNSAVISGNKYSILKDYRKVRARGKSGASAHKGPYFPKIPERIIKRTIRGMLSYKQKRGDTAFRRIICYNNVPEKYKASNKVSLQKEFSIKTIKLKEISKLI